MTTPQDTAKATLRKRLLAQRRQRAGSAGASPQDSPPAALLAQQVLGLAEVAGARTVACYVSMPGEPPTETLITEARARGLAVLLPVLASDGSLDWRYDDGSRLAGRGGTQHPGGPAGVLAEARLVVVPALAVDLAGHRLGRGGGSYDRALPLASPDATVVALVWDDEVLEDVPVSAHDAAVDVMVTESRVLRRSR